MCFEDMYAPKLTKEADSTFSLPVTARSKEQPHSGGKTLRRRVLQWLVLPKVNPPVESGLEYGTMRYKRIGEFELADAELETFEHWQMQAKGN